MENPPGPVAQPSAAQQSAMQWVGAVAAARPATGSVRCCSAQACCVHAAELAAGAVDEREEIQTTDGGCGSMPAGAQGGRHAHWHAG
jgi:hypothetical protein